MDTIALAKRINKVPVVVGNCTGFVVNRSMMPMFMSAYILVDHGVDPFALDKAMDEFGMSMGPFR